MRPLVSYSIQKSKLEYIAKYTSFFSDQLSKRQVWSRIEFTTWRTELKWSCLSVLGIGKSTKNWTSGSFSNLKQSSAKNRTMSSILPTASCRKATRTSLLPANPEVSFATEVEFSSLIELALKHSISSWNSPQSQISGRMWSANCSADRSPSPKVKITTRVSIWKAKIELVGTNKFDAPFLSKNVHNSAMLKQGKKY